MTAEDERPGGYDTTYHRPVLLREVLTALAIRPDGLYLDGTAGGGGHSLAIASRLTTGRLIALDKDPDAVAEATRRLQDRPATVVQADFAAMRRVLQQQGCGPVDGILLDLGVSSHQLDTPGRGFSYHHDAPLDMRMSQSGPTAADLLARLPAEELERIFSTYGEEKFARRIAEAVVRRRTEQPITTTGALSELIKEAVPAAARRDGHPARRVFQALRIAVNGEMDALSEGLDEAFDSLKAGGRLAVITFHSLEDRVVKQRFASWRQGCTCPRDFPVCICGKTPLAATAQKPVTASAEEIQQNPRSRSAKLRCIEKKRQRETA